MRLARLLPFTVAGAVCALAGTADAGVIYSFVNITANNIVDAMAGEAQLSVDVQPVGLTQASFTFNNSGPDAMSITDIYFDDGTLLGIASIVNGPGVSISAGAAPPDLPGGNSISPAFNVTAGFSADSNPPTQPNGANPGEFVTIIFDLMGGTDINDIYDALDTGLDLRIGIHVQGFSGGGSESFITPAPGAAALMGLAGVAAARRRRR